MKTIEDVRIALWEAYNKASQHPDFCGKSSEAWCEIAYPEIYSCETRQEFMKPKYLMVYSYALGTSRRHFFYFSHENKEIDYRSWNCIDPYKTACEKINEWLEAFMEDCKE